MSSKKTFVFLFSFFILLSSAFMFYYYKVNKENPRPSLPTYGVGDHKIRPFSFTDQEGSAFTQEKIKGKIAVVEYFFTTCKGICPKMNENMSKVYQHYRDNEKVMILSHTVDPKRDTVKAMKEYSLRFDADSKQWVFLTGDKKELYDMARYSYLVTAVDDTGTADIQSDFIHSEKFILVDGTGHIRGQYDGTTQEGVNRIIDDIQTLLNEQKKSAAL